MAQTSACKWKASLRSCAWPGDRTTGVRMIPMRSALAKSSGHSQPPDLAAGISHMQCILPQNALHDTLTSEVVMLTEGYAAPLSMCVVTV